MLGTRIIDGKTVAADLRGKVMDAVHRLRRDRGVSRRAGRERSGERSLRAQQVQGGR